MNTNTKRLIITATLVAATAAAGAIVPTASSGMSVRQGRTTSNSTVRRAWTPNDCIQLNHGDFNACNVGNSGRGDLPYQPVSGQVQFRSN